MHLLSGISQFIGKSAKICLHDISFIFVSMKMNTYIRLRENKSTVWQFELRIILTDWFQLSNIAAKPFISTTGTVHVKNTYLL